MFTIALHCATVPNAASERQTLPPLYKRMNLMSSLSLNVGGHAARTSGRVDGAHSRWQVILPARLQECKSAGMTESVTACYQTITLASRME
ncbi:hypothetical protein EAVVTKC53_00455 [Elizabethkingia anophelis]|nr:hypothetical protein EAVVTKC53_01577 [Elizabethkingia anophelis]CAI9677828.1 hypothetical protein EAVVTKC53_00455 [Elizabethkingia anophelis]